MREIEVAKIKLLCIYIFMIFRHVVGLCPFALLIRLNYLSKNIFLILNVRESAAQVHYVLGGVARNVADCMSKLGTKPFMISAVGLDMAG